MTWQPTEYSVIGVTLTWFHDFYGFMAPWRSPLLQRHIPDRPHMTHMSVTLVTEGWYSMCQSSSTVQQLHGLEHGGRLRHSSAGSSGQSLTHKADTACVQERAREDCTPEKSKKARSNYEKCRQGASDGSSDPPHAPWPRQKHYEALRNTPTEQARRASRPACFYERPTPPSTGTTVSL